MLFAIADLHLGHSLNKPMDIFGREWENHSEKIKENWLKTVGINDTVIIAGDLSWAINELELVKDMEFLQTLPGKKIIFLGNHDYWFSSKSKFKAMFPEFSLLAKGDTFEFNENSGIFICGTKGYLCPDSDETAALRHDKKLYAREAARFRASIDNAKKQGAKEIIAVLHYPPVVNLKNSSVFLEIIKEYGIKTVVYGHLHGRAHKGGIKGNVNGIDFHLCSADFLNFTPKKII